MVLIVQQGCYKPTLSEELWESSQLNILVFLQILCKGFGTQGLEQTSAWDWA